MSGRGFLLSLFLIWNFTGLMSQTTEVVVDLNNRDFLVSDHFQDITYIKLETSKECLLRYPANIVIDDGLIFIQDVDVFAFSLKGKFLNGFGRIGKGPGEYAMVTDFIVDSKKKNVEILSGTLINCYKYSGEFVAKKSGLPANSFGKTQAGYYLYYNNYRPVLAKGDDHLRIDQMVVIADEQGQIIKDLTDQIDHFGKFPAGGSPVNIESYKDSLQIVVDRNPSVYQLDGIHLKQKYHFTFIPNSLPARVPKNRGSFTEPEYNNFRRNNVQTIYSFRESGEITAFWFKYKQELFYCFLIKSNGNTFVINRGTYRNDLNRLPFGTILNVDDTYVTAALEASDLIDGIEEILKNLNEHDKNVFMKSNASLMEIYKKTRPEDNPILCRYRLR